LRDAKEKQEKWLRTKKEMNETLQTLRDPATLYNAKGDGIPDFRQMQEATLLYKFKPQLISVAHELKHKHITPKLAAHELEQRRLDNLKRQHKWARILCVARAARMWQRKLPGRKHMPLVFVLFQRKFRRAYAATIARKFLMSPFAGEGALTVGTTVVLPTVRRRQLINSFPKHTLNK
jgi:hypothetical protein